jgi:hypothetical protein
MVENGIVAAVATAARMAGCVEVSENKMYELECSGSEMKELNGGPSTCQWEGVITDGKRNIAEDKGFGPRQAHDPKFNKHVENFSSENINVLSKALLSQMLTNVPYTPLLSFSNPHNRN